MKTKKLLSLILSVIMIMSVLPMYASAATQIALKATHVTEWPTAEGEIYYGEPLSKIKLIGGKVVYEGVEVPGHFEHIDPNVSAEEAMEDYLADIKFVPDDTDTYKGFSKMFSKTKFTVHKTTPVLADESKPPVVTDQVDSGITLSSIAITDGQMINPYAPDETSVKKATWKWADPNTVITESGYYEAKFSVYSYVTLKEFILVRIKGDTSEVKIGATISELPTVNGTVTVGDNWSDVKFTGGKVIDMNGEEVAGTFIVESDFLVSGINNSVQVKFIPDDDRYATITSDKNIKITAEPSPIKFVDENGNAIVPEITVPYGTKATDINLRKLATNCNETLRYDLSANKDVSLTVGTHTLEVLVATYKTIGVTPNYLDTTLTFKVVVEPKTVSMRLSGSVDEENTLIITTVNSNDPKPQGTYDVYVDGELYAEKVPGKFTWAPEKSGEYNFRVVYNPIENDPCLVEEFTYQRNEKLERLVNRINTINQGGLFVTYGTEVTLTSNVLAENFGGWRITDANGNEVDLGVDTSGVKITFTMPDFNITVEAIDKSQSSTGGDAGDGTDDDANNGIFGGIWSFFQKLINWFINIIKQMMSLFGLGA